MPVKSIFEDADDRFFVELDNETPELKVLFNPPPPGDLGVLVVGLDSLVEFHEWLGKEIDRLCAVPAQS